MLQTFRLLSVVKAFLNQMRCGQTKSYLKGDVCSKTLLWEGLSGKDREKVVRGRNKHWTDFSEVIPSTGPMMAHLSVVGIQNAIHSGRLIKKKQKKID